MGVARTKFAESRLDLSGRDEGVILVTRAWVLERNISTFSDDERHELRQSLLREHL